MTITEFKHINLPDNPGVYFFKKGKDILYIGKATSLLDRVRSYFSADLIQTRGMLLVDMVAKADAIEYQETGSVLEALLLETELIKQHQPYYNTKEKDDKSHSYVVITKETYPTIMIVRGRTLERQDKKHYSHVYGPFISGGQLREALKIIRKIFPYKDELCVPNSGKMCFNASIGLCPGVCIGKISSGEYMKEVKKISLFLSGRIGSIVHILKKEMKSYVKNMEFESAGLVQKKIYALTHIRDVSLIKKDRVNKRVHSGNIVRIEAYDIAHMQGSHMVGVMVVMEHGELVKDQYRKFIIKTVHKANDPAALKEVLTRRFAHKDWGTPHLVIVDGNEVQKKIADAVLSEYSQTHIPVISVVKDDKHKAKEILGTVPQDIDIDDIYAIHAEVHRFAIGYFRKRQRKNALM